MERPGTDMLTASTSKSGIPYQTSASGENFAYRVSPSRYDSSIDGTTHHAHNDHLRCKQRSSVTPLRPGTSIL